MTLVHGAKSRMLSNVTTLITRIMGPTWGPSGADRTQMDPMLVPWTLLSGYPLYKSNSKMLIFHSQNMICYDIQKRITTADLARLKTSYTWSMHSLYGSICQQLICKKSLFFLSINCQSNVDSATSSNVQFCVEWVIAGRIFTLFREPC